MADRRSAAAAGRVVSGPAGLSRRGPATDLFPDPPPRQHREGDQRGGFDDGRPAADGDVSSRRDPVVVILISRPDEGNGGRRDPQRLPSSVPGQSANGRIVPSRGRSRGDEEVHRKQKPKGRRDCKRPEPEPQPATIAQRCDGRGVDLAAVRPRVLHEVVMDPLRSMELPCRHGDERDVGDNPAGRAQDENGAKQGPAAARASRRGVVERMYGVSFQNAPPAMGWRARTRS